MLSIFSPLVVTPIVTAYLVYDWNRIIVAFDEAAPAQRNTVRRSSRNRRQNNRIPARPGDYLSDLAAYYVIAPRTFGLNHALPLGW